MVAPGAAHLLAGASRQRIDWIDFHSAILAGEGGRCQWEDGSLLFDEVRACYGLQQFALPFPSHVQTLFDVLDQGGSQSVPMLWRIARLLQALGALGQHLKDRSRLLINNVERVPDAVANEDCHPRLSTPHRQIEVAPCPFGAGHIP